MIQKRIVYLIERAAEDSRLAGQTAERGIKRLDAKTGLQQDTITPYKGERSDRSVADLGCQADNLIQGGVGRTIENLILAEGLNSQSFVLNMGAAHLASRW